MLDLYSLSCKDALGSSSERTDCGPHLTFSNWADPNSHEPLPWRASTRELKSNIYAQMVSGLSSGALRQRQGGTVRRALDGVRTPGFTGGPQRQVANCHSPEKTSHIPTEQSSPGAIILEEAGPFFLASEVVFKPRLCHVLQCLGGLPHQGSVSSV